jgi:hypothetical protein
VENGRWPLQCAGVEQEPAGRTPPEGWAFTVKEVRAGCYRVTGVGPGGISAERVGSDEEALLLEVIADAEELSRRA